MKQRKKTIALLILSLCAALALFYRRSLPLQQLLQLVRVAGQIDLPGRALCDGSPCLLETYYLFLCSQLSGHG